MLTATHKHGCHSRPPFVERVIVMDGRYPYSLDHKVRSIPQVMSRECQYSKHVDHPHCAGCVHKDLSTKGKA